MLGMIIGLFALTAAQKAAIPAYFDADLIDGPSARWKWPALSKSQPQIYCGWVNAKNRLGAYTGWAPYYVAFQTNGKIKSGRILGSDGGGSVVVEALCKSAGYDYLTPPRN